MSLSWAARLFLAVWMSLAAVHGSELVEVLPLTDEILMLHFRDGSVVYHGRGESRLQDRVITSPLNLEAASQSTNYALVQVDPSRPPKPRHPRSIGRKSKGTQFSGIMEQWKDGRVVNVNPDHVQEHWFYLFLPEALKPGMKYSISIAQVNKTPLTRDFVFDPTTMRSEAVHVNQIGYLPQSPKKYGYFYHWLGDRGGLAVKPFEGCQFHLVNQRTKRVDYSGTVKFRRSAELQETFHKADAPPFGNFLRVDVAECDFSAFTNRGEYVLSIERAGCSFPFRIDDDVYREPYRTVARALYHNRSGIPLEKPFTDFVRPAPHNPKVTPGFKGQLFYTAIRFTEWGSEGGNPTELLAAGKGPVDSAGWYQDAGDWDSYLTHLRVAQELLLAYELSPAAYADRELNIPESGNKVPDILDEAAWLPRFCFRLRHELMDKGYGTGGIGLRISGDAFGGDEKKLADGKSVGQGSWEDVARKWAVSGEDPWSTYRYAGAAAQLAFCLELARVKDPGGIDWRKEAVESYLWAKKHTRAGDEQKDTPLKPYRAYAAAALFRLTGNKEYEEALVSEVAEVKPGYSFTDDLQYAVFIHALGGGPKPQNLEVSTRMRDTILAAADFSVSDAESKRSLRWAGNWYMPMVVGQPTTPLVLHLMVASKLAEKEPARRAAYLGAMTATCDYFLGGNSLNMTWITGIGERHPTGVLHLDAYYNGRGGPHPGLIPYGPTRKSKDQGTGVWDIDWVNKSVYPAIDEWPAAERWFDNRYAPFTSEFTIHQNIAPAAAVFGFLSQP